MPIPRVDGRHIRRRRTGLAVLAASLVLLIAPMSSFAAGISHHFAPTPFPTGWYQSDSVQVQLRVDVDGFPYDPDNGDYYELLKSVECTGTGVSGGWEFDGSYGAGDTFVFVSIQGPGIRDYSCTATYLRGVYEGCFGIFGCPQPTNLYEATASHFGVVRLDGDLPYDLTATPETLPNAAGWYRTAGRVDFLARDDTSGIAGCSQNVPFGSVSSQFQQAVTGTCTDVAGNSQSRSFTFRFDAIAPTLAPTVSPSVIPLNGSATASANATDAHSGVKSQACDPVDTSTPGTHTLSCSATDHADNTATGTATYSVGYGFSGFAQPVDPTASNVAKAGRTIPLKWRVTDAAGVPVTDLSGVTVTATSLSCSTGTSEDQIEEYASGSSGLQNLGDGQYQFNWSTPKSYANSCKTLRLDLGDGIARTATFEFTK